MIFVVASRTADVMGGVGGGEVEGAAEVASRTADVMGGKGVEV